MAPPQDQGKVQFGVFICESVINDQCASQSLDFLSVD